MKLLCSTLFAILLLAAPLQAEVIVSIADFQQKILRVTYNVVDNDAGKSSNIFPANGYTFIELSPEQEEQNEDAETIEDKYSFEVISVIEKNSAQELSYDVVEVSNKPALKIHYPNPVPDGGKYDLQIIVEAPTNNISIDPQGRYEIKYQTGMSEAKFELPVGHAIVYSNYPVLIHEKKEQTIVQINESGVKTIIVKTRPMKEQLENLPEGTEVATSE